MIAPPPPEYADFTLARAVWQAIGKRPDEMSAREFYRAALFLRSESEQQRKKGR